MGKKTQKKRTKKRVTKSLDRSTLMQQFLLGQGRTAYQAEAEKKFQASLEATRNVLRSYKRLDAILALGVSDLWPENVASPVKHLFAWTVLLGLDDGEGDLQPIASYQEFQVFIEEIYAAWPDFPMLEDFTPEADWGQVKIRLGGDFIPMFYGSCIERTPDFVEAFRITYAHMPEALAEMNLAVAVQASIIRAVPPHTLPLEAPSR
jgi:hypothetical protein